MAVRVCYIHGFGSSPDSPKANFVKEFAESHGFNFMALEYPKDPENALSVILSFSLQADLGMDYEKDEMVFIGTSLGGYWAGQMAMLVGAYAVMVNPSCFPEKTCFKGSPKAEESYPAMRWDVSGASVVIAMDDEVLDPKVAFNTLSSSNKITYCGSGGHRFEDFRIPCEEILYLLNTPLIDKGAGEQ